MSSWVCQTLSKFQIQRDFSVNWIKMCIAWNTDMGREWRFLFHRNGLWCLANRALCKAKLSYGLQYPPLKSTNIVRFTYSSGFKGKFNESFHWKKFLELRLDLIHVWETEHCGLPSTVGGRLRATYVWSIFSVCLSASYVIANNWFLIHTLL